MRDKSKKSIRFMVTIAAFVYALFFVGQVVVNYIRWANAGIDVEWDVNGPQFVIALCIAIAALAGWLLGRRGRIVSCVFAAVVILQFYWWAQSTQRIKVNTGLNEIPGNWIGNLWAGAGYFEVVAFLAALYFLCSNLYSLWITRKEREEPDLKAAQQLNKQTSRASVTTTIH